MTAAAFLSAARNRERLSLRALGAKAGTSAAAIVEYEHGRRDPGWETLERLLQGAQCAAPRFDPSLRRPDRVRNARRLQQVLALAEQLPHKPAARTMPDRSFRSIASR